MDSRQPTTRFLDEAPSLGTRPAGDVSFVSRRPLPVHDSPPFCGDVHRRFGVKPRLTDLAQVSGRNLVSWPRARGELRAGGSPRTDVKVLLRTVSVVLRRDGILNRESVVMHALTDDRP